MPNVNNETDVLNHLVTLITERVVAQIKAQGIAFTPRFEHAEISNRVDDMEEECRVLAMRIAFLTGRIDNTNDRIDGLVAHREEIDKQVNRLTDAVNLQAPRIDALDLLERKVRVLGESSVLTEAGLYAHMRRFMHDEVTVRVDC